MEILNFSIINKKVVSVNLIESIKIEQILLNKPESSSSLNKIGNFEQVLNFFNKSEKIAHLVSVLSDSLD